MPPRTCTRSTVLPTLTSTTLGFCSFDSQSFASPPLSTSAFNPLCVRLGSSTSNGTPAIGWMPQRWKTIGLSSRFVS